jgi:hypothetical protein
MEFDAISGSIKDRKTIEAPGLRRLYEHYAMDWAYIKADTYHICAIPPDKIQQQGGGAADKWPAQDTLLCATSANNRTWHIRSLENPNHMFTVETNDFAEVASYLDKLENIWNRAVVHALEELTGLTPSKHIRNIAALNWD